MIALNNRAAPTQPGTALIVFIDYLVSIIRTLIWVIGQKVLLFQSQRLVNSRS